METAVVHHCSQSDISPVLEYMSSLVSRCNSFEEGALKNQQDQSYNTYRYTSVSCVSTGICPRAVFLPEDQSVESSLTRVQIEWSQTVISTRFA